MGFVELARAALSGSSGRVGLDEAIALARARIAKAEDASIAPEPVALIRQLGGALLLERGRSLGRAGDVDEAIAWLEESDRMLADGTREQAGGRGNLGLALLERHELSAEGRPEDLERAIKLLTSAVGHLEGRSRTNALHNLGLAYRDRSDISGSVDDLLLAVQQFRSALEAVDDEAEAGYRNSLAGALRAQGLATGDASLIVDAVDKWKRALAVTGIGLPDRVASSLNLSNALVDIGEASGDVEAIDQAIVLLEGVLRLVGPDTHEWWKASNNLASSLTVRFHLTGDADALAAASGSIESSSLAEPSSGPHRDVILSNLAGLLHETYEHSGRLELLERSISLGQELVAGPAQPRQAQARQHNLAVSVLARYKRLADLADLNQAIDLLKSAIDLAPTTTDANASRNSLGNALHLRYDAAEALQDLRDAVKAYEAALAGTGESPMDRALVRSGLGVALMTLAVATAELSHLDRAVGEQRSAVRGVPDGAPLQARLLTALADSLALRAERSESEADESEATGLYARACRIAVRDLPEQAVGTAVSWGDWASRRASWSEAARAYGLGLRAVRSLVGSQDLRPHKETWLRAVQGLPQGASYALTRLGKLDRAVSVVESGRAVLLGEALEMRAREAGRRPGRLRPLPRGPVVVYLVPSEQGGQALIEWVARGPGKRRIERTAIMLPELTVDALAKRVPSGSVCRILALQVHTNFGDKFPIPPAAEHDAAAKHSGWQMFHCDGVSAGDDSQRILVVPPSAVDTQRGPAVEDVLLTRDEMANLAWAVERRVRGPLGTPVDRREVAYTQQRRAGTDPTTTSGLRYRLSTTVPESWLPLTPVANRLEIRGEVAPAGRLLSDTPPFRLDRVELPGTGRRVTAHANRARSTDGSIALWWAWRTEAGRGESASGLRHDELTHEAPTPTP